MAQVTIAQLPQASTPLTGLELIPIVQNGVTKQATTNSLLALTTGVTSITGTANQIIESAATGAVTLSLPQNINVGASPTFSGANFSNIPNSAFTNNSLTIGTTNIALGATSLTLAGLTSVTTGSLVSNASIAGSSTVGAISIGTLSYSDTNTFESLQTNVNNYAQLVLQNSSSGSAASTDIVFSNNLGTALTYYGNVGINSSGYTGSGSYNLPNATYLSSTTGDLSIGTTTSNAIHFFVNNGSTDAMTISSAGAVTIPSLSVTTATITGGSINGTSVGATTASTGAFTTLSASSTVTLSPASANVAISPTGTGTVTINPAAASTINNVSIGATVPSTGAFTALTNSATLAQFDSTTKAATTAFTQAVGLKTNARNTVTVTGTLPASYAGSHVIVNSSSSTVQTLPTATSVTAGYQILLTNIGAGSAAVTRNGTDTINFSNGTNGTVLTMFQGDTLSLESNGSNGWDAVNGSVISPYTPSSSESSIGRNVIINGDCSISQLNGSALITPLTTSYPIDNVFFSATQASKLQTQQVFTKLNSLGATSALTVSVLSSYTPIATDYFDLHFPIEGFNFARFQYGTANAKPGSLQFKVNASVAGTYSAAIQNYAGTRSYPFTFVVAVANTDTLIQIPNIPGDTGGTWIGATNAGAAVISLDLGSGTNYKSTANSWQAGNFTGVTGTTNLVSQVNGSTLTITDVQFEVGSVCTQFERKLISQNLFECQRYFVIYGGAFGGQSTAAGYVGYVVPTGNTMRAIPTSTNFASGSGSGYMSGYTGSAWQGLGTINANVAGAQTLLPGGVVMQIPYAGIAAYWPSSAAVSGTLSAQI